MWIKKNTQHAIASKTRILDENIHRYGIFFGVVFFLFLNLCVYTYRNFYFLLCSYCMYLTVFCVLHASRAGASERASKGERVCKRAWAKQSDWIERVFVRVHGKKNTYHILCKIYVYILLLVWCRFGSDQLLDKLQRNKNDTRW